MKFSFNNLKLISKLEIAKIMELPITAAGINRFKLTLNISVRL